MPRSSITPLQHLLIAIFSFLVALLLLGLMLFKAESLARLGLIGYIWYVVLLPIGLALAIFLFSGLQSYAGYTGKVLNGTLVLSGPPVIVVLVVLLGFFLVPQPTSHFDLTIFLHSEGGAQAAALRNQGYLMLDLGKDRRREAIGDKGEVHFFGIPAYLRGKKATATLGVDGYELDSHIAQVTLSEKSVYLKVRSIPVYISGHVHDGNGNAVVGAQLYLSSYTAQTTEGGRFSLEIPSPLLETERVLQVNALGYDSWQGQITPNGNQVSILLKKK